MTTQELHQLALRYLKNHVAGEFVYKQIQKALEQANGVIKDAVEIYYDSGNDEWGGQFCRGVPDIQCELTGKTTGRLLVWSAENNDWDKPDIVLNNEDIFRLVRDGVLDYQQTLF